MSVRIGERSEGKLQVLNDGRILAQYTLQKCKSDKTFPKSSRWIMANCIMDECLNAISDITKANAITFSKESILWRQKLQYSAKGRLESMETLLDLAYNDDSFHLTPKDVEHWVMLIENTIKRLSAWIKSDKERLNNSK